MTYRSFGFRLVEYFLYQLRAVGPHALHSPFLFELYNKSIKSSLKNRIGEIEKLRNKLKKDTTLLELIDFKTGKTTMSSISSIANGALSTPKFSSFLHLLVDQLSAKSVLETGTSLGLNTLYLAERSKNVTTIEGSAAIASLALKNFNDLNSNNIRLVRGDLYAVLESEIMLCSPDFYFLDADHRSTSIAFCIDLILKHTPEAKCIVIHDIYWSKDMKKMWESLTEDPRFSLSVDLFQAGLLFPQQSMEKQHFSLRF